MCRSPTATAHSTLQTTTLLNTTGVDLRLWYSQLYIYSCTGCGIRQTVKRIRSVNRSVASCSSAKHSPTCLGQLSKILVLSKQKLGTVSWWMGGSPLFASPTTCQTCSSQCPGVSSPDSGMSERLFSLYVPVTRLGRKSIDLRF